MGRYRYFIYHLLFLSVLVFLPVFLSGRILAVGADCSDGCDDFIPNYGWETMSKDGYCYTGGGCPSFACSDAGYTAIICSGRWTCCAFGDCTKACSSEINYSQYWGTCDKCTTSGSEPGGGPTYGKITGRMFSDYNRDNQPNGSGETWANSTSACAVYKSDTLNNTIGGSNVIPGTGWLCDGAGAYSVSNDIVTGAKDVTLVGTLPGSVNCGTVRWSYSTSSSASDAKSGSGCLASGLNITTGSNYLWWWAVPNTPPTVTLSPTSISYTSAGEVYPVKVGITDPDPNGAIKIPSTLTAGLSNLELMEINITGSGRLQGYMAGEKIPVRGSL